MAHTGNRGAGSQGVMRRTAHLGQCAHQAPGRLSCSDLGRAQNADPTASAPLWSTPEPEPEQLRPGKGTQPRGHFGQFPCRATWSLSSGKHRRRELVQTQCDRHCERSPHTPVEGACGGLPAHSTTEQVSLNKRPPSPPCVRAEIRH